MTLIHVPIITILPHTHIGENEIQIISKLNDLKLIRRHVIVLNMLDRLLEQLLFPKND